MNLRYALALCLCCLSTIADATARNDYKEANSVICPTKKTCGDKKSGCQCWCSHKCGPREREEDDAPVYVNDDPYGNYCYCKPWDKENVGRCEVKPKANASSTKIRK